MAERFAEIKREVLMLPRDQQKLRDEVYAMRHKMLDNKLGSKSGFDIKHGRGGIVDVEFAVQYLVLAHSADHPALAENVGNIALLQRAADCGLIDAALAEQCRQAYRSYRRHQHAQRLNEQESAQFDSSELDGQRAAVMQLWHQLFGRD